MRELSFIELDLAALGVWSGIRRPRPYARSRWTGAVSASALTMRLLFGVALVGTLAAGCGREEIAVARTHHPPPRGVIVIMIDTLRADHVGAYGSTLGLTPNLDDVAARGVVFEHAVAASSWTRSSIASLFTSRYPTSLGVLGRDVAIAEDVTTLAETLSQAGDFETMGVITNMNSGRQFGFAQGFDYFETPDLKAGYPNDFQIHIARGVTERALTLIDGLNGDRPFFLYLHYVDPHDPYLPHPGLLPAEEPAGRFDGSRKQLELLDKAPLESLTTADQDRIKYLYSGEVKYCDQWIGELLRGLEARGLRDDVLLVITADHGEGLWDHGFRAHGRDLYEEMVHVPLILQFPEAWKLGVPLRAREPVSLLDVAPTLLAAYGIPEPPEYWGTDLLPLVYGLPRPQKHDFVYTELDLDGRNLEAIYDRDLKLIRNRARARNVAALQLYDLGKDPREERNLMDGPPAGFAKSVAALDRAARAIESDVSAMARIDPRALEPETERSLRALGYLGGPVSRAKADAQLASVLDFSSPDHPVDQLVRGFYELEKGRRWMAGRASLNLGRTEGQRSWRIEGWIDLAMHDRDTLTLSVRSNHSEPQVRRIESSGSFVLEGTLPTDSNDDVRLDIECDHDFQPKAIRRGRDERYLCVVVRSVGLI